jgi:transcriptional regulator with XRE-family HTH domain
MYEIFERLLQEKGLKAADVSRATGIKSPVFSEWKKGKSKPNTEKMIKIAKFLDVSVEYLMTGKEPNAGLYSDENADLLIEITHKIKNDSAFADRLARYMSLLSENKKSVDDMIDLMYSKEHKEED